MVNAMLLKVSCEPRITASLNLLFDDGTVKELDIKPGMYGTFTYMSHGATTKVSGMVSNVSSGRTTKKPVKVTESVGYKCDPNFVNSGFLDARPKHPPINHPNHPLPPMVDSIYNDICVITIITPYGKEVKIDTNVILDVEIIYQDSKQVSSPDDDTRIMLIRSADGVFEFSTDGANWKTVTEAISDGFIAKVDSSYEEITKLRSIISDLEQKLNDAISRIAALESPNKPINPDVEPTNPDEGTEEGNDTPTEGEPTTGEVEQTPTEEGTVEADQSTDEAQKQ